MKRTIPIALSLLVLLTLGCSQPETQQPVENKAEAPAPTETAAGPTRVAKVVFIGQKDACNCTRERIDKTWPVVESALKSYKDITIHKIQNDVEEDEADKYDDMKSIMVAPGIFFLDKDEKLVEMLQGEVTAAQVAAALKK